jgi:hypothetical protein
VAFTITDARRYVAEVRWQFAKTMPQWPHEYTVREWRPDLEQSFEEFAQLIRQAGVVKPWPADAAVPRYHHTYLELDGWEYWTMGAPIAETTVINRARLQDSASTASRLGGDSDRWLPSRWRWPGKERAHEHSRRDRSAVRG